MERLSINFENCYGIKKLKKEFIFSTEHSTFLIYAPNGLMKTSFARTFNDCENNRETCDLVFDERETVREISVDNEECNPNNIFVIKRYQDEYELYESSTLLANDRLKKEYNAIHKNIRKTKADLLKELKTLSGLQPKQIEKELVAIFGESFFDIILNMENSVSNDESLEFSNINYSIISKKVVNNFLHVKENKESIDVFIKKYHEMIKESKYLTKDFNLYNAETIQANLEKNNFFKAMHSISLFDKNEKKFDAVLNNNNDFLKKIETEKNNIINNKKLKEQFDKLYTNLNKNEELREFCNYLIENEEIVVELNNLTEFKKKIWHSYFVKQKELFFKLIKEYKEGRKEIERIVKRSKREETKWEKTVKIFNERFLHLPFSLEIKNKSDVVLKGEVPTIEFIFKDGREEKTMNKKELLKVLSTGEQRALYILNIIFQVVIREEKDEKTLFIIDDIADSFDYKNKYAIIEYLKTMSESEKFYIILLTHNFDFFRTVAGRLNINHSQHLIAIKKEDIELVESEYTTNPFIGNWQNNLQDKKKLIASIPFIRNIIEYTKGVEDEHYSILTSLLHYKNETDSITISKIKEIFEDEIKNIRFPVEIEGSAKIIDLISETVEECLKPAEGMNLENKIVLAIAIRLRAEKFMKSRIGDKQFLLEINDKKNQTRELVEKYKQEFNKVDEKTIKILERVNLMTPETIHLNSFMYEPIIDMGVNELQELYRSLPIA